MLDNQLINLLKTFDRKAMTRFAEFAASPYHNKHQDTRKLVQALSAIYPHFNERNCQRAVLWDRLFPDSPHDQPKLALLFTYAWRLAADFLALEQLEGQPFLQKKLQLQGLRCFEQWQAHGDVLTKTLQKLEGQARRGATHFLFLHDLVTEADQRELQQGLQHFGNTLSQKASALDKFYVLTKLRDAVEMQFRQEMLQGDYSARLLESVLHELENNAQAYADTPAIEVYHALYKLLQDTHLEQFHKVSALFRTHEHVFSREEAGHIYNQLQNVCISQINHNVSGFLRAIFELYQEQLQREYLHEDGYLVEWHYKNIVTTALRLGEVAWAKQFIDDNKQHLHPSLADNAYRFNRAAYCHAIGDYDAVLQLLTQVEYHDVRYNLGAKALLLRTYYELEAYEALNALVESFRQYLQRNRLLADAQRDGYYHLFRLTRRAAALRAELDYLPKEKAQKTLEKLELDLRQAPSVFNRAWLEEKLSHLAHHL